MSGGLSDALQAEIKLIDFGLCGDVRRNPQLKGMVVRRTILLSSCLFTERFCVQGLAVLDAARDDSGPAAQLSGGHLERGRVFAGAVQRPRSQDGQRLQKHVFHRLGRGAAPQEAGRLEHDDAGLFRQGGKREMGVDVVLDGSEPSRRCWKSTRRSVRGPTSC